MSIMHCSLLSLGCAFGFAAPTEQSSLTALRALKIAQRRLRPEVRSKLLGLSSSRTDNTLVPNAWRFVFQDLETSDQSRVVTVAAKTSSEHPDTVEAFSGIKSESASSLVAIPQNRLLVNSDQALELVRGNSKLKGVLAAEYRLMLPRSGKEPLWLLNFYGEGVDPVAGFQVGTKTGTIELMN